MLESIQNMKKFLMVSFLFFFLILNSTISHSKWAHSTLSTTNDTAKLQCLAYVDSLANSSSWSSQFTTTITNTLASCYGKFNGNGPYQITNVSYDSSLCISPSTTVTISGRNVCELQLQSCSSLGFDPVNGFYPSGFCVETSTGFESSSQSQCTTSETTHTIPSCNLVSCPDGQIIDSITGSCKVPLSCWDGSVVFGDLTNCPKAPYICPDGSQAGTQDQCSKANVNNKVCHDGSAVPLSSVCPTTSNVTCSDNTTAASALLCPAPSTISHVCSDGSRVQNTTQCSSTQIVDSNVKDSATSTTTSNSTTTNPDGTTSTTTSTEQTDIEINLDGVNSRLDQINETLNGFNEGVTGNGSSLYEKSGKTFGGATSAFMDAMSETAIITGLNSVFVIDITQTTCPSWTLPAVWIFPSFLIDHHCQPFMDNVFILVGGVMILVSTMIAVRISIVG